MPDLEVQPASIRTSGQSLLARGDGFAEQLAAFEQATAAYEGAWGDDTIGTYIGSAYVAVAQWALDCWYTVADELSAAGDDLSAMADAYEQTETDNLGGFDAIGRALG
ncbi:hypothetical protein [Micromonospora costi]|uniref:PE domain-containing protein n=1 Tax=Micromonospora costi TaxID=1530042 RepID=A0A3A9ZUR1_9ACTN|nr:hypothetical protein [Micromonospora costi]RKN52052.1 hypothetical protein D7193_26120 [Micromonospora costi]